MKITSFEIGNFRAFRSLSFEDLERVNLIAGENNVGKTAVLEALWQFSGADQPDLGLRLDRFRGIQEIASRELLFDLFHNYDAFEPIELTATGDWGANPRTLRIETRARETSRIELQGNDQGGEQDPNVAESPHEIVLRYTDGTTELESSGWLAVRAAGPGIVHEGFEIRQQRIPGNPSGHYFSPRHRVAPQEEAERFGSMELQGLEGSIVEAIKPFEPSLRRLATIPMNGVPVIHADVGMGRLIPMGLLGDGIQRVLSWALAFEGASNGMVLVDEIENGIHYSKLVDVWRAISSFSKKFDVQVFATTHSEECVRAAHLAFSEAERYDFRFYRLDRVNGEVQVKALDETILGTALDANLEVR